MARKIVGDAVLFMVVDKMNFSGACVGILFYGVSTQAFSIDRSCGGRNFGAILWSGGLLCGGIIAFALVRGQHVCRLVVC
jgi:hypothetical protein